jgi:hypothetical protein
MPSVDALFTKADSTRRKILSSVDPSDFAWAIPIMRAGYAGRGLVYLIVVTVSLWSIWQGGQAQGTQSAMSSLDGTWGTIVLLLVAAGMFSYAVWRLVDCIWDLEAYGTSAKGIIARAGMIATGLAHAGIGVLALSALGLRSSSSASGTTSMLSQIMQMPGGVWLVGIAGALTIAAGIYYLYKAVAQTYLEHLQANHFTLNWNWMLRVGVAAQGIVVTIIGGLLFFTALRTDPSQAGGLGTVFDWVREQPFGQVLVVALCIGLLGFALFGFVNAAYRIIPKAADDDTRSVAVSLK